ncbi:MAG: hypothetical protein GY722_27435 [bacterium]|nr:hypothetical protein [bacterium]
MLTNLGQRTCEYIKRVLRMAANGRSEDFEWAVDGCDQFDIDSLLTYFEEQAQSDLITIPSSTFDKIQAKKRVRRLDPELSEEDLQAIDKEIDEAEVIVGGVVPGSPGSGVPLPGDDDDDKDGKK